MPSLFTEADRLKAANKNHFKIRILNGTQQGLVSHRGRAVWQGSGAEQLVLAEFVVAAGLPFCSGGTAAQLALGQRFPSLSRYRE